MEHWLCLQVPDTSPSSTMLATQPRAAPVLLQSELGRCLLPLTPSCSLGLGLSGWVKKTLECSDILLSPLASVAGCKAATIAGAAQPSASS